jgi:hydrogenase maturation protein HypF
MFDPHDRRFRYPFINCTNCGPRFTIIRDIPYDRPLTTMRAFEMCDDCAREYHDPLDRRFHAQPVACPRCGPQVSLVPSRRMASLTTASGDPGPQAIGDAAIAQTRALLAQGHIVAIKGLGGFHLACDATDERAVERLRDRKGRVDKPFALMAFDVASIESFCFVSDAERTLLESRERPIVLLRRLPDSPVSDRVAPNNHSLGVMLPYTPLHYLLLAPDPILQSSHTLVMTSGNLSEEPIAIDNGDAWERLADLADYFLLHNRDIETRADDSVVRVISVPSAPIDGEDGVSVMPIRRSRGYCPYPVHLPFDTRPTVACGAELKNTFCLTRDRYAFLSQHIGDLENYPALESYQAQIEHFKRLFRIQPEIIAYDLHPGYQSTQYAEASARERKVSAISVQHHHAHIVSCMAEHGLPDEPVIGIAFDGTGYGTDGKIWGGEFLVARYAGFTRAAQLAYVPLPGGDAGIRRVYRSALAHLAHAGIEWSAHLPCVAIASEKELQAIRTQLKTGLNAPDTSSMGRLFDAVAALIGVREIVNYEAQAAIELEQWAVEGMDAVYDWQLTIPDDSLPMADYAGRTTHYALHTTNPQSSLIIDPAPIIRSIVQDYTKQVPPWVIATRFHNSVAEMAARVAIALRERAGLNRVVLSGGVFQNVTLLARTLALLRDAQFEIYIHRLVPPNDGGISLGQAAVANALEGGPK